MMVEWSVPMHTSYTNTHQSPSIVSLNTDKERNTYSGACLRSILIWQFTIYFKAGRYFLAWAITSHSAGCVHNAARHNSDPLLWDMSSYLPLRPSSWVAGQRVFLWPGTVVFDLLNILRTLSYLDERHHIVPTSISFVGCNVTKDS